MKKIFNNIFNVAIASAIATSALTSCQDTEYPAPDLSSTATIVAPKILFANAAPDSPALNFFVNNAAAGTNIGVLGSSAYNTVTVGPVQLRGKAASGNIGGSLGSTDLLFRAGATNNTNFSTVTNTIYTVFVTDSLTRPKATTLGATDPGGIRFLTMTDILTAPAASTANLRFFNLSPDAPALWINILSGSKVVGSFTNKAYRAVTATFTGIPSGIYTVEARITSATGKVVLSTANVNFDNGKIYSLYTTGFYKTTKGMSYGIVSHI